MDFNRLLSFIKRDGCPVRLYDKKMMKDAQSIGTFDVTKKGEGNPIICIALKGHSRLELIRVLLHEYAHFCQWKDGFMQKIENAVKGHDVLDKWLKGKKYAPDILYKARNAIILLEYDAEIRTIQLSRALGVNIGRHKNYYNNAHSYVTNIKNVFRVRHWDSYHELDLCYRKLKPSEILKPLSIEEKDTLDTLED